MKNLTDYEMEILKQLERYEAEQYLDELVALDVDVNDVENLIWPHIELNIHFKDFLSTMECENLTSEQICNVLIRLFDI